MEIHQNQVIDSIILHNQCGAVIKLRCIYKDGQDGKGTKSNEVTGSYPVGQTKEIDLNTVSELMDKFAIGREMWVSAFVDVVAGKDDRGKVWFRFKPGCKRAAVFTISGVINFTSVGFNELSDK